MPSRAALLAALAAATALLAVPAAPAPAGSTPAAADDAPLQVTIDSLTPSTVPTSGPLRVTGSVTNTGAETWRAITVYGLNSQLPITSSADLAEAAESDPNIQVGERITAPGTFDPIGDLAPGESSTYSLRIPRAALTLVGTSGIYWFGVHALGETDVGRDTLADGRARTFLPLVDADERLDLALVLSLRRGIWHAADGSIARVRGWARDLGPGGRLTATSEFGSAAEARSLTWLVDPALPDVAARLAAENPPRDLGPSRTPGPDDSSVPGSDSPEPTEDPSESPPPDQEDGEAEEEPTPAELVAARAAETWLARTRQPMLGDEVLALPYGDVDVPAATRADPEIIREARLRAGQQLPALRVPTRAAIAAPDGYLDEASLDEVSPGALVLVSDRMVGIGAPSVAEVAGRRVLVASSRAAAGGPGPDNPMAPVAVRQRLLSEAALALLSGRDSLVMVFPPDFDFVMAPARATEFFEGLDLDWLRLTALRRVAAETDDVAEDVEASYPERQADLELPATSFAAARALMDAGRRLDSLLPATDTVARQTADEALTGVSYAKRETPKAGVAAAHRSTTALNDQLELVTVDPPPSVTLSSEVGTFSATLTNGLDQTVLVRLQALSDAGLEIPPSDPVELGPDEQATVLMEARSSVLGVHRVDLVVSDADGNPVGVRASFPLRAAQTSDLIWLVWGVGAALIFGTIGVRLFRRIRGQRAHPQVEP